MTGKQKGISSCSKGRSHSFQFKFDSHIIYKLEGTQPIILQSKRSTVLSITGSMQAKEYPKSDSTSTHCEAISPLNIQCMPRIFNSNPCPVVGFFCVQTRRQVKQEVRSPLSIARIFSVKNKSGQFFSFLGHQQWRLINMDLTMEGRNAKEDEGLGFGQSLPVPSETGEE